MHGDLEGPGTRNTGRGLTIGSFVCAGLAIFFLPLILGGVGIALGLVANSKGDPLGKTAAIVSGVCAIAGMVLAYAILSNR